MKYGNIKTLMLEHFTARTIRLLKIAHTNSSRERQLKWSGLCVAAYMEPCGTDGSPTDSIEEDALRFYRPASQKMPVEVGDAEQKAGAMRTRGGMSARRSVPSHSARPHSVQHKRELGRTGRVLACRSLRQRNPVTPRPWIQRPLASFIVRSLTPLARSVSPRSAI